MFTRNILYLFFTPTGVLVNTQELFFSKNTYFKKYILRTNVYVGNLWGIIMTLKGSAFIQFWSRYWCVKGSILMGLAEKTSENVRGELRLLTNETFLFKKVVFLSKIPSEINVF